MRTAYLTLDEVNTQDAIRLGSRCGQEVHLVDLRSPTVVLEPVVVLDLDHLPESEWPRLFGMLLPRTKGQLAVHAYHLPAETIHDLLAQGLWCADGWMRGCFVGCMLGAGTGCDARERLEETIEWGGESGTVWG